MSGQRRRRAPLRRAAVLAVALGALGALPSAAAAVDLPPPTVTGAPGQNGWYVGPVTVKWSPTGETASSPGCVTQTLSTDTTGTSITCTVSDGGGGEVSRTVVIHLDRLPPANVAATPARPPDAPPFYTGPVPITWSATDPTSGVASCTTTTYAGPDGASVAPQGACLDRAGNASAPLAVAFAYDATAPPLTGVTATAAAHRRIAVNWATNPEAQTVSVTRQPGGAVVLDAAPATTHTLADGPLRPAVTYTYDVTVRDAAGNATTASASATTPAALTAAAAARANAKNTRTLRWKARRGAKYYNLQLFRNGRKVLSAWPKANRYALRASWRYRGRTHMLTSGRYRWYVWPGYGSRAAHRYGRLVTKGAVTVPATTAAQR